MKKLYLFTLLTSVTCNLLAQNDCDKKIKIAANYLLAHEQIDIEALQQIQSSLSGCLTENSNSNYVKGLLALNNLPNPDYTASFNYFQLAANEGNANAITHLAYFFKYGWDREVNFDEAYLKFQDAAALDDDNANYSLGYFFFCKGLGSLEQDYETATNYFSQSNEPMARHWEAVCQYFGFGTEENKALALTNLVENKIPNSQALFDFLSNVENTYNQPLLEYTISESDEPIQSLNEIVNDTLYGKFIERDWSGEKIMRQFPISLYITKPANNYIVDLTINDQTFQGIAQGFENKLSFQDFIISIPALFVDNIAETNTLYTIKEIDFKQNTETSEYIADLNIWIENYTEPSAPISLIVRNKNSINQRIENSIIIFPNNFLDSTSIQYTIEQNSQVNVALLDFNGIQVQNYALPNTMGELGTHIFRIDATNLPMGNYILQLNVDGYNFPNQIIKIN